VAHKMDHGRWSSFPEPDRGGIAAWLEQKQFQYVGAYAWNPHDQTGSLVFYRQPRSHAYALVHHIGSCSELIVCSSYADFLAAYQHVIPIVKEAVFLRFLQALTAAVQEEMQASSAPPEPPDWVRSVGMVPEDGSGDSGTSHE